MVKKQKITSEDRAKLKAERAIKRLERATKKKLKEVKNLDKVITTKPLKIKKAGKTVSGEFSGVFAAAENAWGGLAADGIEAGDISGFIDTGSYSLNALVSGKMRGGGFPNNKIAVLAGEEATGKTFFVIESIKRFLQDHLTGAVFFFETESAISKDMLEDRGVDTRRVFWLPVSTVQECSTQCIRILDKYMEMNKDTRSPMLLVLDSLGMLSTSKEIGDTTEGKETKDMTRAGLIKAMFRIVTLKLGRAGVAFFVTNHTYEGMGMFATKQMSGGQGTKYAASNTIFLSSRKEKEGTDVVGRIITCTLRKGRITKQDKKIEIALNFDTGLNRYYGLLDIGQRQGIFKKIDKKWNLGTILDGKVTVEGKESDIYEKPEEFFVPEIMDRLELACQREFLYGQSKTNADEEIEELNVATAS